MSALGDTLRTLAEVLDELNIDWYLFGAQAVAIRGAPRATQDVDVTVLLPVEALPALANALRAAGLEHRHPESADELLNAASVLPFRHVSGMELDLVIGGSGLGRRTHEAPLS